MKIKEWKLFQVCWEQAKRACCNKGRLLLPYQRKCHLKGLVMSVMWYMHLATSKNRTQKFVLAYGKKKMALWHSKWQKSNKNEFEKLLKEAKNLLLQIGISSVGKSWSREAECGDLESPVKAAEERQRPPWPQSRARLYKGARRELIRVSKMLLRWRLVEYCRCSSRSCSAHARAPGAARTGRCPPRPGGDAAPPSPGQGLSCTAPGEAESRAGRGFYPTAILSQSPLCPRVV